MNLMTSLTYEMIGVWCGPLFVLIFVICFGILGQNLPQPISPASDANTIAAYYVAHNGDLRLGWMVCLVFISLYMPWSAQISNQMTHIERHSRFLTYLQLIGGALTVFVVSFGMLCWGVAAFRPDRDANIVQMLHDIGWLSLETQWALTTMQMLAMAFVGLADKREQPLFPRWVCWLTIWCGLSFAPASFTFYFKTGPFAWNGLLSYYVPYPAWLVWCVVASIYMSRDVARRGQPWRDSLKIGVH
jgi:hypothetical protein